MSVETHKVETSTQSPTHEVKTTKETKKEQEARPPQPLLGSAESRERLRQAEAIIKRNTLWAVGAGALIFPVVDVLAASAVQLKMLKNLSDLYGVKFSEGIAKKLVSSLLMSLGGLAVGVGAASLIKLIPGVGSALGVLTFPLAVAGGGEPHQAHCGGGVGAGRVDVPAGGGGVHQRAGPGVPHALRVGRDAARLRSQENAGALQPRIRESPAHAGSA